MAMLNNQMVNLISWRRGKNAYCRHAGESHLPSDLFHWRPRLPKNSQQMRVISNKIEAWIEPTISGWWFGRFSHILGMSSSQLTFIFFRGVGIPPTRYQQYFNSRWRATLGINALRIEGRVPWGWQRFPTFDSDRSVTWAAFLGDHLGG